jgi:hypothetical protein
VAPDSWGGSRSCHHDGGRRGLQHGVWRTRAEEVREEMRSEGIVVKRKSGLTDGSNDARVGACADWA